MMSFTSADFVTRTFEKGDQGVYCLTKVNRDVDLSRLAGVYPPNHTALEKCTAKLVC
jgi:hypothetical protein